MDCSLSLQERIYQEAKSCLGKAITLDPSVPIDVRCAEATSYVLLKAGVPAVPPTGIAGTGDLYAWFLKNPAFRLVGIDQLQGGDIIISPSGYSKTGAPHGHVGIAGKVNQGIMSNNSDTGTFLEAWSVPAWVRYYSTGLGFPIFAFRAT